MKHIIYFFKFLFIIFILTIFKIIGLRLSRILASKIFSIVGPFFRSKKIIEKNISYAFHEPDKDFKKNIINSMWKSYGKILAEYVFMKYFRKIESKKFLEIKGQEILEKIKLSKKPVIFVSGHFDNFELMAMTIEKAGINLAAIYRPLNNIFLNKIMENLRKKYICKNQIKKGRSSVRNLLKLFNDGSSIALMIDQRVSEGIKCNFFNKDALTTTIPAQFVKKFNCKIIPINIERKENDKFKITVFEPIKFDKPNDIETITKTLNLWLEKIIVNNPSKWIWSHDRWK